MNPETKAFFLMLAVIAGFVLGATFAWYVPVIMVVWLVAWFPDLRRWKRTHKAFKENKTTIDDEEIMAFLRDPKGYGK